MNAIDVMTIGRKRQRQLRASVDVWHAANRQLARTHPLFPENAQSIRIAARPG
jgi:hypothetical protein